MKFTDKKIIILVENMYNERAFRYPYYKLKENGAEVVVVGPVAGLVYVGVAGITVKSDAGADAISAANFDGLVIPGGYAPDHMRRHQAMVKLLREMAESDRVVAAIYHAGWMLASADILRGRTITSFFAIKDDVINAGASYVDQEVAVDGRFITSRTPDHLPAFMKAVIAALR